MLQHRHIIERMNACEADIITYVTAPRKVRRIIEREARKVYSQTSVALGGGKNPKLGTRQDASTKLMHNGIIVDVEEVVMYMMPANKSGIVNLCHKSTKECRKGCLNTAGRLLMDGCQIAQQVRTVFMIEHTFEFLVCLVAEHRANGERIHACGKQYWDRLNGTADIMWEQVQWLLDVLRYVGTDLHFDYTKIHERVSTDLYYLAPSATEHTKYSDVVPGMVIIVDTPRLGTLPTTWYGFPVIDGDHEFGDLRPLDRTRPDAVVLLRAKGKLQGVKGRQDGFVKESNVRAPISVKAEVVLVTA
jgi:hypothetical protein